MKFNISVLNIILVVVISLFFVEKTFAQTGCEGCTITNPTGGHNATLTVNVGDVICFTQNRTFGNLTIHGGTICIAEGVKVTIINNVSTTIGTNINLEIYGTLQFDQVTTLKSTVIINIYNSGELLSGTSGSNDFSFNGSGISYINNYGKLNIGTLTFSNSSGEYIFDNYGEIDVSSNINIGAKLTKFKNNFEGTMSIGASFNMNEGTEFYNCGEITTASGFNMEGGNVVNTNSFTVNGNVNYGNRTSRFDNFGTLNINNGDIQMADNAVFYNEGVAIFSGGSFANNGNILGPEEGSGKLGYIYFDKAVTMNNGSIGPNLNFKNTNGTSSFAVMFNDQHNINIEDGVSWDCESSGTCAAEKQIVLDLCPDFDGNFPDPEVPLNSTNAVDDFFETGKNTSVSGNVKDNDYDLEGNTQTVTKAGKDSSNLNVIEENGSITFETVNEGKVTIDSNGNFTYTPPVGGFSGFDKFEYQVCDDADPRACDIAEVEIGVGICIEEVNGKDFDWTNSNSGDATIEDNTLIKSITQPATTYGFIFDIYKLDNSFNMEINGVKLAEQEIEFQAKIPNSPQNIRFQDGTIWEQGGIPAIWELNGDKDFPIVRVVISPTGKVAMYGSKTSGGELHRLVLFNGNKFNIFPFHVLTSEGGNSSNNIIKVTQNMIGTTKIEGLGFGANMTECPNYWYGEKGTEWDNISNWTDNYVPKQITEDVEFATKDNNSKKIIGISGSGAGKGPAKDDLYVPENSTKKIKNLINETIKNTVTGEESEVKSLVIPPNSGLIIYGNTVGSETDADKIIVKADKEKSTGTLIFTDPDNNKNVQATVEFYNKAYECANCGYFRKGWQYFGIPVSESGFPYLTPKMETINEWMENVNGNKWVNVEENRKLHAFRGYEMTNSSDQKPTHIYDFSGILNVGDAEVALTKTPNVDYSGMNLIGNSFTAAIPISEDAISYSEAGWDKKVYLFNTGTRDQWRKLNGGTVTHDTQSGQYKVVPLYLAGQAGLNDRIPSMHTFMVNAPSDGTMTLAYNKLVKNQLVDGMAWRSAQSEKQEIPHIVLDVIGSNSADRVWLFEHAGTTRGFDAGWDGVKMPEKDIVQLYVTGENNTENYQVATVPQMIGTSFGMQPDVNESYTLSVAVSADVEARGLYLRDMLTGRSYALKNGAEYKVQGSAKSDNRFKVVDTMLDESKLGDNPLIDIYVMDSQVVVANNSDEDCTVTLYDAAGKLVGKRAAARNSTVYMSNAGRVAGGVYVVKVAGTQHVNETKRVVVK